MALHLERHPGVRATFNFVPSLLDQLDDVAAGAPEALAGLMARPPESLTAAEQAEMVSRCSQAPRHAFERWPSYRALGRPAGARGVVPARLARSAVPRRARGAARAGRGGRFHGRPSRRLGGAGAAARGARGPGLPGPRRARPDRALRLALLPSHPAAARRRAGRAPRAPRPRASLGAVRGPRGRGASDRARVGTPRAGLRRGTARHVAARRQREPGSGGARRPGRARLARERRGRAVALAAGRGAAPRRALPAVAARH